MKASLLQIPPSSQGLKECPGQRWADASTVIQEHYQRRCAFQDSATQVSRLIAQCERVGYPVGMVVIDEIQQVKVNASADSQIARRVELWYSKLGGKSFVWIWGYAGQPPGAGRVSVTTAGGVVQKGS